MVNIKLKEVAQRLGKTSVDIAKETGINRNTIDALLKGKVSAMKFPTLEKICTTYQLSISDLLELEKDKSSDKQQKFKINRKQYKQEGEITPFTSWPWMLATQTYQLTSQQKTYGFSPLYLYAKEDYAEAYWDVESLEQLARVFYSQYSNPRELDKLYNQFLVSAAELEDLYFASQSLNPEVMSIPEMQELFTKIKATYHDFWDHSLFIDAFDPGFDMRAIQKISRQHSLTRDEAITLTTPEQMTFTNERKLAFLKLAKKILRGNPTRPKEIRQRLQKHNHQIEAYKRAFNYHHSSYAHIKQITDQEIWQELQMYVGNPDLVNQELHELSRYTKHRLREIQRVLKKHHLQTNPLWFFKRLIYWRELRKKFNLMGFQVLDIILKILEAKTGIPKKYLMFLDFDEVDHVVSGLIPASTLKERRGKGILIALSGTTKRIFTAQEALSLRRDLEATLSGSQTQENVITGQTACAGHAQGVARIILTRKDFDRFKKGEILITSMTRPEFLPIVKKAAAIVTNEGGITCHAAIVSRELGIPAVIGTKNATQRLKDGDLIEVRASHGTVRILRS